MEVSSSALAGALRVGVQVIVAQKRPVMEIYQDVRNEYAPPFDIEHRSADNKTVLRTDKHRMQDVSITVTLVNSGSERAESISFVLTGDFKREDMKEWPRPLGMTIPQFAPGQTLHLMSIWQHDLLNYGVDSDGNPGENPVGTKTERSPSRSITMAQILG